ncbi:MAG: site-specific DNA-methyltransferase [Bacteroidales bacterium]|jgi:adenine-specific DNA-methyltransferase|nr:site-specific DNA-methyltransferase [Bacteroidales bacterium]
MPTTEQLRTKLLKKLSELFQLNQPDLDFGFYRIMHAKAKEVQSFIDKDLLQIVADSFGEVDDAKRNELQATYEKALRTAKDFGAPHPEETEAVKKAKMVLDAVKDTAGNEAEIYDHLYRFFERYYDDGDFISRRYYTRETSGKAAPYAVPYNGEEVKLHWANADQYYIKSTDYFSNYSFDLIRSAEVSKMTDNERVLNNIPETPYLVHFRLVNASEGEHGNIKVREANKRFFIIHMDQPVLFNDDGELIINFEYRNDPEKTGYDRIWRDKKNAEAVEYILNQDIHHVNWTMYKQLLSIAAPTDKDKKRPLLAKYINQYTARNTMDYFIHKDLGTFLKRELDFYIKNEVMQLDDIENAEVPFVETYLSKIKVLRKIAGKLIDFLAQLENFQKKLWLKKKFVIETNYCITLDRVPEELLPEIITNDEQIEEWITQFAINEIDREDGLHGTSTPGLKKQLSTEFLKTNNKLVLDTKFFDEPFKAKLIASIENIDEQCNGLLIHSENFQALNTINERYKKQVKCIYIDPPFNLGQNGDYLYKTDYKNSTWATLLFDRIVQARSILLEKGIFHLRCDYNGNYIVRSLIDQIFGPGGFQYELSVQRIRKNVTEQGKISLPLANDSLFMAFNSEICELADPYLKLKQTREAYWRRIDDSAGYRNPPERVIWGKVFLPYKRDAHFKYSQKSIDSMILEGRIMLSCKNRSCDYVHTTGSWSACPKCGCEDATPKYLVEATDTKILDTNWMDVAGYSSRTGFSTENAESLLERVINVSSVKGELIADYFAGSGTTLAVALKLGRPWIGIEMAEQFDKYILPRLKRCCVENHLSYCFKYIRLESYEDTLNNLRFNENQKLKESLQVNSELKQDYMLNYLIDVETKGSQSLLNIDAFANPTSYSLELKNPGSDEYITQCVDLLETFNYLIGLRVQHINTPITFTAAFIRARDPELPEDQNTKLVVDGKIRQDDNGLWWFRKVEGWVPKDPANPNNGQQEKILIVWRKLTGNLEEDNLMLDEWFQKNRISTRDFEFDTIYVNGSNNLPNLKLDGDNWKVRLTEEVFMKRMWDVEGL